MKKLASISVATVLSVGIFFADATPASAQWITKVTLGEVANGHPGFTEFRGPDGVDRLFLTWGGSGNDYFNSLTSTDGVNWGNKFTRRSSPLVAHEVTGGISMTTSYYCGYAYTAWRDGPSGVGSSDYGTMWAMRSQYGTSWDGPYDVSPGWYTWSAPSLRGDNSALPIGAAFAGYYNTTFGVYYAWKEKFNCNFSGPTTIETQGISGCFFNGQPNGCSFFSGMYGGWTPLWTGANGTTELLGIGTGAPPQGVAEIIYQKNANTVQVAGTNWTNNGLGGAVNPANGTPYIAWTCDYYNSDTCHNGGGSITIVNVNTGAAVFFSNDTSDFMPALTFFNGKIWVAWAGTDNHYLNIGSISPF